MALDVWFREDIERTLRAAATSSAAALDSIRRRVNLMNAEERRALEAYYEGYHDALTTVALSFGVSLDTLLSSKELPKDRVLAFELDRG